MTGRYYLAPQKQPLALQIFHWRHFQRHSARSIPLFSLSNYYFHHQMNTPGFQMHFPGMSVLGMVKCCRRHYGCTVDTKSNWKQLVFKFSITEYGISTLYTIKLFFFKLKCRAAPPATTPTPHLSCMQLPHARNFFEKCLAPRLQTSPSTAAVYRSAWSVDVLSSTIQYTGSRGRTLLGLYNNCNAISLLGNAKNFCATSCR